MGILMVDICTYPRVNACSLDAIQDLLAARFARNNSGKQYFTMVAGVPCVGGFFLQLILNAWVIAQWHLTVEATVNAVSGIQCNSTATVSGCDA
jgi:hypothetical protein